ncbi:IS1/IS1595 family N-terminal zinc-binding domain-containing protein [Clostridium formicaceticum]|uniref:InsA N-terminal zinc ribbon domain-containing protein n=1 Tax=Clostridium formicaceticum TaxID=1497 RepID=A0AAC9RNL5_9CLOT|nr:IS1 family transposase [Clostridium formicaceticum]AOY74551.1 hypothetical protein BJL90_00425 [Clostridium formicaceticum]ARE88907.1 hypothetical protein CLFO_33130 [Clostridium formicaceticum]
MGVDSTSSNSLLAIKGGEPEDDIKCPHCKSLEVIKHGKVKEKQRYRCKECTKTFSDTTLTPFAYSKKALSKWEEYANCFVEGYSLRKTAGIVGISLETAFIWRHKILDAIRLNVYR